MYIITCKSLQCWWDFLSAFAFGSTWLTVIIWLRALRLGRLGFAWLQYYQKSFSKAKSRRISRTVSSFHPGKCKPVPGYYGGYFGFFTVFPFHFVLSHRTNHDCYQCNPDDNLQFMIRDNSSEVILRYRMNSITFEFPARFVRRYLKRDLVWGNESL